MSNEGFIDDAEGTRRRTPTPTLPTYKVWNSNPKAPGATPTPGVVMRTMTREGERSVYQNEVVESVRVVFLYRSIGRKVEGQDGGIKCQSHGYVLDPEGKKARPSLKITEPFCRDATAADLAKVFSEWKGFDAAKVDAKIQEVTEGTGCLQVCGLKAKDGSLIALCPSARWTKVGRKNVKPDCKPHVFVVGYDLERNREFKMELTGGSIQADQRYTSPFANFFASLRGKPEGKNVCFAYEVTLGFKANGAFYVLDVHSAKELPEADRSQMEVRALDARDRYLRSAMWLSKEQYEAQKAQAAEGGGDASASQEVVAQSKSHAPEQSLPASFDDDDIPFG